MSINHLKILSALILSLLGSVTASGQGYLYFGNRISPVIFAPVYDSSSVDFLFSPVYSAQLYAGTNGLDLHAVGMPLPFRTGLEAGSWAGSIVTIPWANAGDVVTLQVRVWYNAGGVNTSFESACGTGLPNGTSSYFASLPLGGGSLQVPPPNIIGNPQPVNNLQPFSIIDLYPFPTGCEITPWRPWPPWLSKPVPVLDRSFAFDVSAAQPGTCVIDSSTNLVTWTPILTNAGPAITVSFTDTNAAASSTQKFYRARTY